MGKPAEGCTCGTAPRPDDDNNTAEDAARLAFAVIIAVIIAGAGAGAAAPGEDAEEAAGPRVGKKLPECEPA